MDDLLTVFRYLANNRHQSDNQNPYNIALQALNSYLDIEREVAFYAEQIRKTGGLDFEEAERLTERVVDGFETGLLVHHDGTALAITDLVQKYVNLDEIDSLIEACQEEKARMQREYNENSEEESEE